jgi:hypothetical protein
MTHGCQNCITLEAKLIRSEEKRIRDAVTYQVKLASSKHKVKPGVEIEKDLIARVLSLGEWKEEKDGQMVLYRGGLAVYAANGYSETTPEVAVRDLRPVAEHFYIEGEDTATNSDGKNPWAKNSWNMTSQGQIVRDDPAKAKRLAAAAGITLSV